MKKALWASLALLVVLVLPGGLIGAFCVWAWNWRRVRGKGVAVDKKPDPWIMSSASPGGAGGASSPRKKP